MKDKSQIPLVIYTDNENDKHKCDSCDKIKFCVHFYLIGKTYGLCKDCVTLLINEFKK